MTSAGQARLGAAGQGAVRNGLVWQAWRGMAGCGGSRKGVAGTAWHVSAPHGRASLGRRGRVRQGVAWLLWAAQIMEQAKPPVTVTLAGAAGSDEADIIEAVNRALPHRRFNFQRGQS